MRSSTIVIVVLFAILTAPGIQAEIYSWTDENGVKHYSHTPPPEGTARVKTAQEIPTHPQAASASPEHEQAERKIYKENIEVILDEIDRENERQARRSGSDRQRLSRQERIQNERKVLEEKLAYLESLPASAFANSRSRNVIIGKYQYRLQQLMSDPDSYYEKWGF